MVGVAHRQCRQDERMAKYQWRLSFSRAEIVLLNSWMPVQQIVYHMLRVFAKTKRLTDSTDNSGAPRLSNYHIKTLMLWASEVKPRNWWTDDLSLCRICVELLHILSVWLNDVRIPHYFVGNCNLIDNSFDTEMIASHLMSLDREWLSAWFLNNYLRKCSRLCSDNISLLFDDASTSVKLQTAVSVIVTRRLETALYDLPIVFASAEDHISFGMPHFVSKARSCAYTMNELAKIDTSLSFYFTAVAFLYIAEKISRNNFDDELVDVLATCVGQYVGIPRRYSKQTRSILMLTAATKLMSVVANKSLSALETIKTELSKAYLHRALRYTDAYRDSINCLANVYLAVLYYTTGNYDTAIDHCTLVTRSDLNSDIVQGKLLPKIDDNIDNVLGLSVLYQYLRTTALQQEQCPDVDVFTTVLFAHYMQIKCLLTIGCRRSVQMSLVDEIVRYRGSITDTQQFAMCDVLVVKLEFLHKSKENKSQKSAISQTVQDTSDLVELLQRSAIEHLTTYRQFEVRDFGSAITVVFTDFQALYAYKRGDYQQCLQLCTQNLHALLYAVRRCSVSICPAFIPLLDDDIVSLFSLALVINPKFDILPISQLTLLLYLLTQCVN